MATTSSPFETRDVNGSAMAALLGAGIGSFAMGAVVLLNEAQLLVAPALYAPAGGVSGRTTLATVIWLIAWGVLHHRWKTHEIAPERVGALTVIAIALGVFATLPSVWALL